MVGNLGPRRPLLLAGTFMTLGALLLVPLSAHEAFGWLVLSFAVFAAGFGLVNAPITNTAVSGLPRAQAGVAAAIASTSRQVGAALGVAVVGSVLASGVSGSATGGFVSASHAAWWVIAGCGLLVLIVGAATTGRRATASAERAAQLVADDYALTP
jgi:MFS family permease